MKEEKALTVLRAYYGPTTAVRRLPQHGATLCAHGCAVSLCRDDNGMPVTVCRTPAVVHGFAVAPHTDNEGAVHVLAHGGRSATLLRVDGEHTAVVARTAALPDACVAAAVIDGDGTALALGFAHGFVEHWHVAGAVLRRCGDDDEGVTCARCWPGADTGADDSALVGAMALVRVGDGSKGLLALTADPFGTVTVWDAHTGHCHSRTRCHAGPIHCIAPSSDDNGDDDGEVLVATCSTDRTTRLWTLRVDEGEEGARLEPVATLYGHAGRVWVCACVRVGSAVLVAAGGEDGSTRVWTVVPGAPGAAGVGPTHTVWAHRGKHVWALDLHRAASAPHCVLTTAGADGGVVASWIVPDATQPTAVVAVHPPGGSRFAHSTLLPADAPPAALFVCEDGTLGTCTVGDAHAALLDVPPLPFAPSALSRVVPAAPSADAATGPWVVAVAGQRGELAVVEFGLGDTAAANAVCTTATAAEATAEAATGEAGADGRVVSVFVVRDGDGWLLVTCTWRGVVRVWRRADAAPAVLAACGAPCTLPRTGTAPHCVATCCAPFALAHTHLLVGDERGALHCLRVDAAAAAAAAAGTAGVHVVRTWPACHGASRVSAVLVTAATADTATAVEAHTCGYDGCVCRWALTGVGRARPRLRCASRGGAWQGMHQLDGLAGPAPAPRVWGLHCAALVVQGATPAPAGDVRTYATAARRRDCAVRLDAAGPRVLVHRRTALALEDAAAAAPGAVLRRTVYAAPTHGAETNRVVRLPFALAALPPLFPGAAAAAVPAVPAREGPWFVTASRDHTLRVWGLQRRGDRWALCACEGGAVAGHTSTVKDVAFCTTARGAALAVSVGGNFELLCHRVLADSARACPCLVPLCSGQRALETAQARDRHRCHEDNENNNEDDNENEEEDDDDDENRCRVEAVAVCGGTAPDEAWVTCGASDGRLYSLVVDAGADTDADDTAAAPSVRAAAETPVCRLGAVPLCMRTLARSCDNDGSAAAATVAVGLSSGAVALFARTRERCCAVRTLDGVLAAGIDRLAGVPGARLLCVGDDGALALAGAADGTSAVLDRGAGLGAALEGVAVVEGTRVPRTAVFVGLAQRVGVAVCDDSSGVWRVVKQTQEMLTDVADAKDIAAWHDDDTRTTTVIVAGQGVESLCIPDDWMEQ